MKTNQKKTHLTRKRKALLLSPKTEKANYFSRRTLKVIISVPSI